MLADVKPFYEGLRQTRIQVIAVAGVITIVAVLLALFSFQSSMLIPLRILTNQLRLLRQDRSYLGKNIKVDGNQEICELAENFNKVTSELGTLYKRLESIAYTDPITKLANRARFHDLLHEYVKNNQRKNKPFALLIIDVDRFKAVNDSLGHNVGDQLLSQVGARIEKTLRKSDITTRLDEQTLHFMADKGLAIARLGGDEFSALLPGVRNDEEGAIVAQKLLNAMVKPFILEGNRFNINISIGVVLAPQQGTDASILLRRADVAVAEAKQNQCGYMLFDKSNDEHRLFQLGLERELRHAIDNDELELYFQPQLNLKTGELWGAEALVRWHHPDRGFISPDQFIPLAEQSGLVHPLTLWVLNNALKHSALWLSNGFPLKVSVNISARSLHVKELPVLVSQILEQWQMASKYLSLEITESAVMEDPSSALVILGQLDAMGIELSIDDFGTGYSSMMYLKKLPVDELKIDRSFISEMERGGSDEAIVRSIIDLSHNMGLRAVAEGVEDANIWDQLVELGCDIAQGHYIARPMASQDFMNWIVTSADQWRDKASA